MNKRILRVKTIGSRKEENLRPLIVDELSQGVSLMVLEYERGDEIAVIKLTWSSHPLLPKVPQEQIETLLTHPSVVEVLPSHPKDTMKRTLAIVKDAVDEEKTGKRIRIGEKEGSFIRKERLLRDEEHYIIDEG